MVRKRTKYSDTFEAEAVKVVIDGSRPIATVANELDINPGTLGVSTSTVMPTRSRRTL
ncbi:MAG: transposase [Candidatus Microthrix sp.]|uniref:transposase n=1 Tax=Candidatus Neomicrothrix sp. TaxID=2719034 RepID=UPI002A7D2992|nr:transposase [Candidatus Microthrix sp.]